VDESDIGVCEFCPVGGEAGGGEWEHGRPPWARTATATRNIRLTASRQPGHMQTPDVVIAQRYCDFRVPVAAGLTSSLRFTAKALCPRGSSLPDEATGPQARKTASACIANVRVAGKPKVPRAAGGTLIPYQELTSSFELN